MHAPQDSDSFVCGTVCAAPHIACIQLYAPKGIQRNGAYSDHSSDSVDSAQGILTESSSVLNARVELVTVIRELLGLEGELSTAVAAAKICSVHTNSHGTAGVHSAKRRCTFSVV